jgi:peptide/nickel transport system substrate-binding protein
MTATAIHSSTRWSTGNQWNSTRKKRKELVWAIERKLAEDAARPILWHNRTGTCWHPYVKGYTLMVNSVYNGWRMEDVWLDN